jgi:hypothetical protein
MSHCGVTVDDPRNAGIIEYFRPKAVTTDLIVRILAKAVAEGTSSSFLGGRVFGSRGIARVTSISKRGDQNGGGFGRGGLGPKARAVSR